MRLFTPITLIILCFSCACNKEARGEKVGAPEMNGIYAYVAKSEGGTQNIYLQNRAGTENISSSWRISSPSCPRLSADGRTLLFQGREGGRWRIYTYDVATGELPECISGDIPQDCRNPRFMDDGNIIFSKDGQISILDMKDGSSRVLTFEASAANSCGDVLPDGRTCIYLSGSGASARIMKMDMVSKAASSVKNTSGATSFEIGKNGEIIYGIAGKGIFVDGKTVFTRSDAISGAFGDWVLFKDGDRPSIGNTGTKEIYPLNIPSCEGLVYADASVSIARPKEEEHGPDVDVINSDTARPALRGRMVYHNYTSYDAMDSRMYVYDFATDNLQEISAGWTVVRHPMNGHFSDDGSTVTFMGIGTATDSWDIFIYELGSGRQPENLTPAGDYRDEDPKFSFDGRKICFKRNGQLSEIDVATKTIRTLSSNSNIDFGMPYYSVSGDKIVFGGSSGQETFIGCWDIESAVMTTLYDKPGTVEYYPITIDGESFYFTGHVSATSPYDQLYIGYWDGRTARYLPFNNTDADYSDACPVSDGWLILCSTRYDSRGQYDLYIANADSGAIYPLSSYNSAINTTKSELGASYTTKHLK